MAGFTITGLITGMLLFPNESVTVNLTLYVFANGYI